MSVVKRFQLYRCYDRDERLVYIGLTTNPRKRMQVHMAHTTKASVLLQCYMARWEVDADTFATREEGRAAEAQAIWNERPLFNQQDGRNPTWIQMRRHLDYINAREPHGSATAQARLAEYVRRIERHINCDADELGLTPRDRKNALLMTMYGEDMGDYSPFVTEALRAAS